MNPPINRFIPTGVGNTHPWRGAGSTTPVHPHGRGEHSRMAYGGKGEAGSSPRAWGTQARLLQLYKFLRFIPTGVGNTGAAQGRDGQTSVHPHGRGEHPGPFFPFCSWTGSSPRAWGTLCLAAFLPLCGRFIPTGVGNTAVRVFAVCTHAVHPHGRGEHTLNRADGQPALGSSPRAWGTQFDERRPRAGRRFIPTGVGNTVIHNVGGIFYTVHPHGRGEHSYSEKK